MGTEPSKNTTSKQTTLGYEEIANRSAISLQESDIDAALPKLMNRLSPSKPATGSRVKIPITRRTANTSPKESSLPTGSISPRTPNSHVSAFNPTDNPNESATGNGVSGKLISTKICHIVAIFWIDNIVALPIDQKLEIACSIFFSMQSTDKEMRSIMKTKDIESVSLKYLDMFGWLARALMNQNIDLYSLLRKLGAIHRRMGVRIQHFAPMLVSMHQTFSYYFPTKYVIEVKYALDEIFTLAAQIMTNEELKHSPHLNDINGTLNNKNIPFLQSLRACLESSIGSEYLKRFLQQTFCDEIVIFLQLIKKFRKQMTDKERFMLAREIVKSCIDYKAVFGVNISYEAREAALHDMDRLERQFIAHDQICFIVPIELFSRVEIEIHRLIRVNHWGKFVVSIKDLQSKSNNL